MSRTTAHNPVTELAYRATEGLEVALLWHESASSVNVAVSDSRTGEAFELVLGNDDNALDVFHHPYAYAATGASTSASTRARSTRTQSCSRIVPGKQPDRARTRPAAGNRC